MSTGMKNLKTSLHKNVLNFFRMSRTMWSKVGQNMSNGLNTLTSNNLKTMKNMLKFGMR